MWKLISTKEDHWDNFTYVIEECVIGRKDSTLLIANDPSVSRRHAVLSVRHPEENLGNPSKKSSLFLRDEDSKYGTFKNKVRVTKEVQLSDGDVIKIGQFQSEFRIHYEPLVVTTSCLDITSKNKLKKVIHKLGGHISSEWQPSCTHLVMNSVKITIKALCCLVSLKPIVLPEYFEELAKELKASSTVVPPKEFIPPIGESLIDKDVVSFDVNPERKNLFKNKTFFFMDNKQFKKLHLGVITGGGKASILSEGKFDQDLLLHENNCFIEPVKSQLVTEQSRNLLKDIINTLQLKNLRMIPESDIGLAVAYASTEKFCNPRFDIGSVFHGHQIPSQSLTQREVYVPDTQESVKRPKPSISNFLSGLSSEPNCKKQKVEAADSLNLTSFREDPEEVFEIPLSAEIKRELDDIFDVQENVEKELDVEPTLLIGEEPEFQIDAVDQNKTQNKTEKVIKNINLSKIKIEENTSIVNGNTSCNLNDTVEEKLPRNLITVKFASLVVQKAASSKEKQVTNSHVKNFKKFRKVLPLKSRALPRIIGRHELAPYDKDAAKLEENLNDEAEVVNARPVKGIFDWGSQN